MVKVYVPGAFENLLLRLKPARFATRLAVQVPSEIVPVIWLPLDGSRDSRAVSDRKAPRGTRTVALPLASNRPATEYVLPPIATLAAKVLVAVVAALK